MAGKTQHFEGADGRLYFRYPLHARYLSKTTAGEPLFEHAITACEYIDGKELYTLACNGAPITGAKTLEQVDLILGFFDHDMTEPGERVELPLLEEEVRLYYEDLAKELKKANAEANAKLKGTEYFKLKSQIESLSPPLRFARSCRDDKKAAQLEAKLNALTAEQHKILESVGVDRDLLTKKASCAVCGDSGFTPNGVICSCAIGRAEQIKKYNAELRLARRKI